MILLILVTWARQDCQFEDLPIDSSTQAVLLSLRAQGSQDCFLRAVERGFFQAGAEVVGRDKDKLQYLLLQKRNYLSALLERVAPGQVTVVEPVKSWTQEGNQVSVRVKLSHRWDSPPCTRLEGSPKLQVEEDGARARLQIACVMSGQRFSFELAVSFYDRLQDLELENDSLGQFVLRGTKTAYKEWPSLEAGQEGGRQDGSAEGPDES